MSAAAFDPFRYHGGDIEAAARLYPAALQPWIDLSTGVAPWAYPTGTIGRHVQQHLPSAESLAALEFAAASAFGGLAQDQIVAVPGSDLAIRLLSRVLVAERVGIIGPTYRGYHATWPDARMTSLQNANDFDLMVCANPNNPDGRVIEKHFLQNIDSIRIVDEAFADAQPADSLLPDRKGAIVLRSFGKFFGLAGIRLGFVIADAPVIRALRHLLGDWPVSGPAITIGTRAYCDLAWQEKQRLRLTRAADRLSDLLDSHALEIVGRTRNFVLCKDVAATQLFGHLCEHGILTRPFAEQPLWLRFGLPSTKPHWHRLDAALAQWRNGQ